MSRMDYLPENPNYPQVFKFPDNVNNNLKIKYHYLDATFVGSDSINNNTTFLLKMDDRNSNLLKNYKNVKSIELISAVINTGLLTNPILYMFVDEFDSLIDSNQRQGQRAFAKLFFKRESVDGTTSFISDIKRCMNPILEYEVKGKRLDKMTISFAIPDPATNKFQFTEAADIISLTFKIGVIEPF